MSRRTGTGHHHTRLAPHARRGPVQAKQKWPGRGKAQTLPAATDETVRTSRGKTGGALAEPGEPLHGGASLWRRRRPVLLLEPLSRPPGARRGQPAAWPLQQRWGALGRWLDPQRGEESGAPRFRWTSHFQPCVRCLPPGAKVSAIRKVVVQRGWVERKQPTQAAKSRRRGSSWGWSNHVSEACLFYEDNPSDGPPNLHAPETSMQARSPERG